MAKHSRPRIITGPLLYSTRIIKRFYGTDREQVLKRVILITNRSK